jgi:hypothetical protein
MTRKGAARSQHDPGAARSEETEDGTGRVSHPSRKTKALGAATIGPDQGPVHDASGMGAPLTPPHPALVELVRLLARADARRARSEERGTQ